MSDKKNDNVDDVLDESEHFKRLAKPVKRFLEVYEKRKKEFKNRF